MMDSRLKLPCLARALETTRFPMPGRGFVMPHTPFFAATESVAKWGNWHCGENKERFQGRWQREDAAIIEPFVEGQAVRVLLIGEQAWQIRLEGDTWLKSIHAPAAAFMPLDPELLEDTRALGQAFGLAIVATDYIVAKDGRKVLLEVNHIPNVTRFPEIWQAYLAFSVAWIES